MEIEWKKARKCWEWKLVEETSRIIRKLKRCDMELKKVITWNRIKVTSISNN